MGYSTVPEREKVSLKISVSAALGSTRSRNIFSVALVDVYRTTNE